MNNFTDKRILITGGTGSFGGAVLKRLEDSGAKEIRIFSRDEKKQDDLRKKLNNKNFTFYIGDIRNKSSVMSATEGIDCVFHAAALKQVPSCEFFPSEAVKTNILGTENLIDSAIQNNVKKVVCLSTDKAVYPINAMGISKAMMEKILIAKTRNLDSSQTTGCCTRYGNVMASRGSVIPLFVKQIFTGQPITITDPKMTRFMMSLEDSVDLVLFALSNGESGEIFVQKAPAVTLETLVDAILKIFDKTSHPVDIIGTRHGEKLYETLLSREEMAFAKEMDNFYCVKPDTRDLNYSTYIEQGIGKISDQSDYTSHNTLRLDVDEMMKLLLTLPFIQNALSWQYEQPEQ